MDEKEIVSLRKAIIKLRKKRSNIQELLYLLSKKDNQLVDDIDTLKKMENKEWETLKEFKPKKPVEEKNWSREYNKRGLDKLLE